jgi:hypothetical protein
MKHMWACERSTQAQQMVAFTLHAKHAGASLISEFTTPQHHNASKWVPALSVLSCVQHAAKQGVITEHSACA